MKLLVLIIATLVSLASSNPPKKGQPSRAQSDLNLYKKFAFDTFDADENGLIDEEDIHSCEGEDFDKFNKEYPRTDQQSIAAIINALKAALRNVRGNSMNKDQFKEQTIRKKYREELNAIIEEKHQNAAPKPTKKKNRGEKPY